MPDNSSGHDNPIPAHFTASAVIIFEDRILLIDHRRIGAWLPPGGHLDQGEMPHEACLREVLEETGLACRILSDSIPETGDSDALVLPQPLCIHRVLAFEGGAPVIHIDIAYLCEPLGTTELIASDEVLGARWVPLDQLNTLKLAKNVPEIVEMAKLKLGVR
jgi:8-oxo-dGTP diphosphatase